MVLKEHHQAPSVRRRAQIPQPPLVSELIIEPDSATSDFNLFYLDRGGKTVRTTRHERLDLAIGQAEWDHSVAPQEWYQGARG